MNIHIKGGIFRYAFGKWSDIKGYFPQRKNLKLREHDRENTLIIDEQ